MSAATPKAFAVPFAALRLWSVRSFFDVRWDWPEAAIRPLGDALDRRHEAAGEDASALRLLTIQFDGSISARTRGTAEAFKGKLFRAEPGDVVYSKIDVRNGAIGLVPETLTGAAVSAEYPVYAVRRDVADPDYVTLLARTQAFRRIVNGMVAGASGRKRVTPELLESIRVPLPSLSVQRAIVAHAARAEAAVGALAAEAAQVEATADAIVYEALGTPTPAPDQARPKVMVLPWADLSRWSTYYLGRQRLGLLGFTRSQYPIRPLCEVITGTANGRSIRPTALATPYKVLKLSALTPGGLDVTKAKPAIVSEAEAASFGLVKDDLLICRSVGSFNQVAKCAVVEESDPNTLFPDIMIRARFTDEVLPAYAREVFQTPLGRSFFQTNARTAVGMWKIGAEDIAAFPLPVPPLDVQARIVAAVATVRAEASRLRLEASRRRVASRSEVEAMILGTAPPPTADA